MSRSQSSVEGGSARVNSGFTFIELVIVLVILGVLAAFAVPRFIDLSREAKLATLENYGSAFNSANSMNVAACVLGSDDCVRIDLVRGQNVGQCNALRREFDTLRDESNLGEAYGALDEHFRQLQIRPNPDRDVAVRLTLTDTTAPVGQPSASCYLTGNLR